MIARRAILATSVLLALTPAWASAQSAPAAQVLPPGFTVQQSAGGYEAAPPPGSLPAGAPLDASASSTTASPALGPQQQLGKPLVSAAHYAVADIIAPPVIYSPFTPGTRGDNYGSYAARAAFEVPVGSSYKVMVGADAQRYTYQSTTGVVSGLAGQGRGPLPSFDIREYQVDERAGLLLIEPKIYVGVSYLQMGTTANAPRVRGLGYGLEKLVDSDRNFSLYGSVYYYPNVGGNYTVTGNTNTFDLSYKVVRYQAGATIAPLGQPFFLDAGFMGDKSVGKTNAPGGYNHQGPFVGLGLRF
jgi:hypothetical protein